MTERMTDDECRIKTIRAALGSREDREALSLECDRARASESTLLAQAKKDAATIRALVRVLREEAADLPKVAYGLKRSVRESDMEAARGRMWAAVEDAGFHSDALCATCSGPIEDDVDVETEPGAVCRECMSAPGEKVKP